MPYAEREPYEEELTDAERAPEAERTPDEYEPYRGDIQAEIDTDSVDAKLGGEEGDWAMADKGESGYTFDGTNVIGPDGTSWLEAWGDSPENSALYEEMVAHFAAKETVFALPDYTEQTDGGKILYKTFMLLNENGSVGYDIQKYESVRFEDEELPSSDDESDEDDRLARLTESEVFSEPVADAEPVEEQYREAAAAETLETAPQTEGNIVHETIETYAPAETITTAETSAQTIEQEAPAVAQRATAVEAGAWLATLLAPVMYRPEREERTEAAHTEPMIAESAAQIELAIDTKSAALVQPEQDVVTMETHSVIPDLPVYASEHTETLLPPAGMREEAVREPEEQVVHVAEATASVAAAQEHALPERETAPPLAMQAAESPALARVPQAEPRPREVVAPSAAKDTSRERAIPPVPVRAPGVRRETAATLREPAARHVVREPQRPSAERPQGSSTRERQREPVTRTARAETRAAHVPVEIMQRIVRGKPEPVHPARQAQRAHWYLQTNAQEHNQNDNAPQPARNAPSLNGITLSRAA